MLPGDWGWGDAALFRDGVKLRSNFEKEPPGKGATLQRHVRAFYRKEKELQVESEKKKKKKGGLSRQNEEKKCVELSDEAFHRVAQNCAFWLNKGGFLDGINLDRGEQVSAIIIDRRLFPGNLEYGEGTRMEKNAHHQASEESYKCPSSKQEFLLGGGSVIKYDPLDRYHVVRNGHKFACVSCRFSHAICDQKERSCSKSQQERWVRSFGRRGTKHVSIGGGSQIAHVPCHDLLFFNRCR
jgi:hypothetical protein